MKKTICFGIAMLCMIPIVLATVSRSVNEVTDTITYTSSLVSTYDSAYWAIEETFSGCSVTAACPTASDIICSYSDNVLRVTGYASNQKLPIAAISFTGTDGAACAITGSWVESRTGSVMSTPSSFVTGSLTIGIQCNTDADTDCNGDVSDSELLAYASRWLASEVSDSQLLQAANAWING